jgi:uncharacterized membrane protein (UPF0182 family)
MYPYSEPFGDMGNYVRNSVGTVNAYDGEVRFISATRPIP